VDGRRNKMPIGLEVVLCSVSLFLSSAGANCLALAFQLLSLA
jgi:hypothetical protein